MWISVIRFKANHHINPPPTILSQLLQSTLACPCHTFFLLDTDQKYTYRTQVYFRLTIPVNIMLSFWSLLLLPAASLLSYASGYPHMAI
jgi:hypothetical protein